MTNETDLQPASDPVATSPTPTENFNVSKPVPSYEPLLFTYEEAAKMLGISESWLRKQGALGTIPVTRLGRAVRFSAEDLQQIINEHREGARPRVPPTAQLRVADGCRPSRRART